MDHLLTEDRDQGHDGKEKQDALTKKEENNIHYSVVFFFVGKRVCLKKKLISKDTNITTWFQR
jgi:hypothetical protein